MVKASIYAPHEQEVLDRPDYFIMRLFQQGKGWVDSKPWCAKEILIRFKNVKEMPQNYRVILYAVRGERIVCVTPDYVAQYYGIA